MKKENSIGLTYDQLKDVIAAFAPCMNDFLYVYDLADDVYYIAEDAVERFNLPSKEFHNVLQMHYSFVHEDDIDMLVKDLAKLCSGEKNSHDLVYRWIDHQGNPLWINCVGRTICNQDGNPQLMIGCINEIGKAKSADNVSGLMSENLLLEDIETGKLDVSEGVFLRLKIDRYKEAVDQFGHEFSNELLHNLGLSIQSLRREDLLAYHVFSDHILLYVDSPLPRRELISLYNDILNVFLDCQEANPRLFTISAGIVYSEDIRDFSIDNFHRVTEFVLDTASKKGTNEFYFFDEEDYREDQKRKILLEELKESVGNYFQGFHLNYQPIVRNGSATLHAAEALLRFQRPNGETVSPTEFIPLLEESNLIIPVGKWILTEALDMCKECRKTVPDFKISVNLSYVQITRSPIYMELTHAIERSGLPADALIVELTESGKLDHSPSIERIWARLKDYGVNVALDDFGTGYSNLMNIGDLNPNIVKIDRTFAERALTREYEYELLIHIIKMVHSLDLKIVIEGIETETELSKISSLNPDYIQGFYYSKPCSRNMFMRKYCVA